MSAYEKVADSVEAILATKKPVISSAFGLNPRVAIPPVFMYGQFTIDEFDFITDVDVTPDIVPDINIAFIIADKDLENGNVLEGVYRFHWIRAASDKQKRGASLYSKHMILWTQGVIANGKLNHLETDRFAYLGGRWLLAMRKQTPYVYGSTRGGTEDQSTIITTMHTFALSFRYKYSVILSDDPSKLSARVFGDARTLRFMLRTRDIGNQQRRRALIHMVKAHARRHRKRIAVRAHLRGEHQCRWGGLDIRLLPSPYDVEQAERRGAPIDRLRDDGMLRHLINDEKGLP